MDAQASTQSSDRVGISVVVLVTSVRVVLIVLALLVELGVVVNPRLSPYLPVPTHPITTQLGLIMTGALVVLLVVSALCIIGLIRRLEWGWTLSIVTAGATLAMNIGWWMSGDPHYLSMAINAVVVFYLNQRDIRHTFNVGVG
jgi:hypothetical protein